MSALTSSRYRQTAHQRGRRAAPTGHDDDGDDDGGDDDDVDVDDGDEVDYDDDDDESSDDNNVWSDCAGMITVAALVVTIISENPASPQV